MTALPQGQVHEIISDGAPSTYLTIHRGSHIRTSIIIITARIIIIITRIIIITVRVSNATAFHRSIL